VAGERGTAPVELAEGGLHVPALAAEPLGGLGKPGELPGELVGLPGRVGVEEPAEQVGGAVGLRQAAPQLAQALLGVGDGLAAGGFGACCRRRPCR
jgi:hypothetical protein